MNEQTILLVGYGWFRSIPEGETNNAECIARALDGERIQIGELVGRIHSLIVPVVWDRAFALVRREIERLHPDVVLALGTDARASAMRPEPVGVNWSAGKDADPDDPTRETERNGPICEGGPDFLRSTLPFEAITRALLEAGIPAQLGGLCPAKEGAPFPVACTAGAYLCNFMAYHLALLARDSGLRAGFMHVPTQPAYAAASRLRALDAPDAPPDSLMQPVPPSMALDTMIRGTRIALETTLRHISE